MANKRAVILDVDGTLIDTNAAHLEAWQHAFEKHGYPRIARQSIWAQMGKGGDQLVPALIGWDGDAKHGKALRATEAKRYLELTAIRRFAVFRGVEELFQTLRRRHVPVAIATSSNDEQIAATERASGLGLRPLADVFVTKSDAPASKPEPDLIEAALAQLCVQAAECVMVGDTEHDGEAAARAHVTFVGLTCGGNARQVLEQGKALRVFEDPLELADRIEDVLALP